MPKTAATLLRCLLLAGLVWGLPAQAGPASIYTVESTVDNHDAAPGNNICADSNGVSAPPMATLTAWRSAIWALMKCSVCYSCRCCCADAASQFGASNGGKA